MPQRIVAFAPSDTPSHTIVFKYSFFLEMKLLGVLTFVKTTLGPQKTFFFISTFS